MPCLCRISQPQKHALTQSYLRIGTHSALSGPNVNPKETKGLFSHPSRIVVKKLFEAWHEDKCLHSRSAAWIHSVCSCERKGRYPHVPTASDCFPRPRPRPFGRAFCTACAETKQTEDEGQLLKRGTQKQAPFSSLGSAPAANPITQSSKFTNTIIHVCLKFMYICV